MSQHDLNIANQGFPAFRADLNDALVALGSTNSGATAPATTFANQLWYDTANNILKIRNEDNDAWISIATLDQTGDVVSAITAATVNVVALNATGVTTVQAGTALLPAIITSGDTNTGIWFPAADTIAASTGGSERFRIDSSGNIGVGSNVPNSKLQILGTTNSGYAASNAITSGGSAISNSGTLSSGSSLRLTADFGGAVNFTGRASELVFGADNGNFASGGGFPQANLGAITSISENGNATTLASSMLFYTSAGNNISERMRITSAGSVLIGTTANNGSTSNSSNLVAGKFSTVKNQLNTLTQNTATTIFTVGDGAGIYTFSIFTLASNIGAFSAYAVILYDGNDARILTNVAGGQVTITLSGLNVQVTQTFFNPNNTFSWGYQKQALT